MVSKSVFQDSSFPHGNHHVGTGFVEFGRAPYIEQVNSANFLRRPYLWFCLGVGIFFIPVIVTLPALNDLFVHAATLERLQENFWSPRDPMVNEPGLGNPYFSPYMVFWAALAKLTGMGTFTVLRMGAIVNLFLFLGGLGMFVRTLTPKKSAPVYAALAIFFLWGTGFLYWSGFISFPSLIASIAYPSTFAVGMGLWIWVWLAKIFQSQISLRRRIWLVAAISVGGSVVALSHQFTALGICIYAALYVLRNRRNRTAVAWLGMAAITVLVTMIVLIWPWFNLLGSTGGVDGFNAVHKSLYTDLTERYGLLIFAIPALLWRLYKDKWDPLTHTVIVCLLLFVYGGLSGNYFLGRIFPPVALLSQIAVGIVVAEWVYPGARIPQKLYAATVGLAIIAGAVFQSGFVNLMVPGSYPTAMDNQFGSRMTKGDYLWLTEHVRFGESVMTANWDARAMAPGHGIFTVMPAWPDPFLGEKETQRRSDTLEFFKKGTTPEQRGKLMLEYDARWVIVVQKDSSILRKDPNFRWVAERPDTGPREEDTARGRQQLFEFLKN